MSAGADELAPQLRHVQCLRPSGTGGALARMAYWEWPCTSGAADAPVLVCVHGLSRQGRDFDVFAQAMRAHYRVICPDVLGRGESDWLADPTGYQIPFYVSDMVTLVARLGVEQVDWVGTSMGGLIGMGLGALPNSPVRRMVLNDVGPVLEFDALQRIGEYLGKPLRFDSEQAAAQYMASISIGFGPHSEAQWMALSRPMLRHDGDSWHLHYDPKIAVPFGNLTPAIATAGEQALWAAYDALRGPVLLLRGALSDLLSKPTAQAMTERGPHAQLREIAGVGHAPMLVQPDQVEIVKEFLLA